MTACATGERNGCETGLDYFLARYYSAAQGRFTSPDEFPGGIVDPFTGQQVDQPGSLPYADITDPQTLNKYAYVRNNPLKYVDPDGHAPWLVGLGVGGGLDIAVQMLVEQKSLDELDWGSVGISAAAGAIGGGLAAKLDKLAPVAKFLINSAMDAGGSVAQQLYKTGSISPSETVIDVIGGRVAGEAGEHLAKSAAKNSPAVKALANEADRKSRIAAQAEAHGNAASAARRSAQASALNSKAADMVYRRSAAASTSASQLTSTLVKKLAEKKREDGQQ